MMKLLMFTLGALTASATQSNPKRSDEPTECEICGAEFIPSETDTPNAKFCSKSCWRKDRRIKGVDLEERVCVVCGETFSEEKGKRPDRVTCSRSCGLEKAWSEGKGGFEKLKFKPRKCAWCSGVLMAQDKRVKYCSVDCKREALAEQRKSEVQLTPCPTCGKMKPKNKKYCSRECYIKDKGVEKAKLMREKTDWAKHPWVKKKRK